MKRQTIDQEKMFVYHVSEIGLASRIYKELLKLSSRVINNLIRKMCKRYDRHCSEEYTQMTSIWKGSNIISH